MPPMPPETSKTSDLAQVTGLPSFSCFIDCQTSSDVEIEIEDKQKRTAHMCILASKLDTGEKTQNLRLSQKTFDTVYDLREGSSDLLLYSTRQSKTARLSLLATGKFADVTLVLEDGEIRAHRILLASGSELMKAMLIGSWRESNSDKIKLTGWFKFCAV